MTADHTSVNPEELADLLWTAWETTTPLPSPSSIGQPLSAAATTIASKLQRRMLLTGAEVAGTKIGAGSTEAQKKLGTNAPFSSQFTSRTVYPDGAQLQASRFIAPLLEAEIALVASPDGTLFAPSAEVADCRFRGWDIDIQEAIADFGLHGALIVGIAVEVPEARLSDELRVAVSRDREVLIEGRGSCGEAMLGAARSGWVARNEKPGLMCATGAIPTPVPLTPGRWDLDFGMLGRVHFFIEPDG